MQGFMRRNILESHEVPVPDVHHTVSTQSRIRPARGKFSVVSMESSASPPILQKELGIIPTLGCCCAPLIRRVIHDEPPVDPGPQHRP